MERVIVGVDGSEQARDALAWAVAEARLRGAVLRVVNAWRPPEAYLLDTPAAASPQLEEALAGAGSRILDDALGHVLGDDAAGVEIERRVVRERPVEALLEAASDADLLVVGSRGHGGFRGLLLGSVSQQCAQHAPCPVVIVHRPEDRKAA